MIGLGGSGVGGDTESSKPNMKWAVFGSIIRI